MSRLLTLLLCWLFLGISSTSFAQCEAALRTHAQAEEVASEYFQSHQIVVIVNPVSSSNQMAAFWKAQGYETFFAWTNECSDRHRKSFRPDDFSNPLLKNFSLLKEAHALETEDPTFDSTLNALRKIHALVYKNSPQDPDDLPRMLVVSGAESGVKWAQKLSANLKLPTSVDPSNIRSLRHKHAMHRNFEKNGINIIPQIQIHTAEQGQQWIKANHRKFSRFGRHWDGQYLLKPVDGASSNQLSVIEEPKQLEAALEKLKKEAGIYGQVNKSALLMPLLKDFREFAVNGAVARDKKNRLHTRFTGVWEYMGRELGTYGYEKLLPWYNVRNEIFDLVKRGLEASRYQRSAFHWEVMYLKDLDAFYIVEGAGRLYGAGNTRIEAHCTGYSQIQAMVDSYLNPEKFIEEANRPYKLSHMGVVLNISGPETAEKKAYADDQVWESLRKQYRDHIFDLISFMPHQELLTATHNLSDTLAQIELIAPLEDPYSHSPAMETILAIKDEILHLRGTDRLWSLAQ